MFSNLIYIFSTIVLLSMPILFWMYVVVGYANEAVSRLQFFIGIGAGGLIALILSFHENIYLGSLLDALFFSLFTTQGKLFDVSLFFGLSIIFFILCVFISSIYFLKKNYIKKIYQIIVQSYIGYIVLIFLGCIFIGGSMVFLSNVHTGVNISFGDYTFALLSSIISYYVIISFLEEGGKYFSSLASLSSYRDQYVRKKYFLLIGVSIALGFSFFETILYAFSYIRSNSFDIGLLQLIFFRSVFSLSLHIFSALFMSLGFWYILFGISYGKKSRGIKFIIFALLSILVHMLFDLSITFGYIAVMFLYVIALYISFSLLIGNSEDI